MLKQTRTRDRIPMDQLVDSHRAAKVVARLARPVGEPKPRHPKMTIADRDADPDMLAAYFRSASRIPVPSWEQTDELARRIEASEHNLLCALLRSAVLGRELSDLARKLDEGSVSPWDILIGAVPKTATAKQAAHDRLRLLFSNFEKLDAECGSRRTELLSRRVSESRAAQLHQELEALWQQMAHVLAEMRPPRSGFDGETRGPCPCCGRTGGGTTSTFGTSASATWCSIEFVSCSLRRSFRRSPGEG